MRDSRDLSAATEKLKEIYQQLSQNRVLRSYMLNSSLTPEEWRDIERLSEEPTEIPENNQQLRELYLSIEGMLRFLEVLRDEVAPAVYNAAATGGASGGSQDRLIAQMTRQTLPYNIQLLHDRLADVYPALVAVDRELNSSRTLLSREFSDLQDASRWEQPY